MDDIAIARAIHVLAVVLWIGGVGFVTMTVLPAVRRIESPRRRIDFFEAVEGPFARQARATTVIVGASGLYMLVRLDAWDRFGAVENWWMHAMVLLWLAFTLMLFGLEPLFLRRWFAARARAAPEATFRLIERLHRALLALSLAVVAGAVIGVHAGF